MGKRMRLGSLWCAVALVGLVIGAGGVPSAAAEDAPATEAPATGKALSWLWVHEGPPKITLWAIPNANNLRYEDAPAHMRTLFEGCGTLIGEMDMSPASTMAMMPHVLRMDGSKLSGAIPEGLFARAERLFESLQGSQKMPLEMMRPAMAGSMIQNMLVTPAGITIKPLGQVLQIKAKESEKRLRFLYTVKDGLDHLFTKSEEEQIGYLRGVVDRCENVLREGHDIPADLRKAYLAGDLGAVQATWAKVIDPKDSRLSPALITKMADRLQALEKDADALEGPVLAVVAIETLLDEKGLLAELRKRDWGLKQLPRPSDE